MVTDRPNGDDPDFNGGTGTGPRIVAASRRMTSTADCTGGRKRRSPLVTSSIAVAVLTLSLSLAACGGSSGPKVSLPASGGRSLPTSTAAQSDSSSGLQTAKPGQVLTGAQVTAPTTLTPVPGTLTGWDNSLSVKTGTTDGVGRYAAAKGQRFVVAELSFGSGAKDRIAQAAGTDAGGPYGFSFGSADGVNDLGSTTVTVTADGRTTPISLTPNLQDQPIAVSTPPRQPVMLGWKDGTTSGTIDLTTGRVTSPTPAAL